MNRDKGKYENNFTLDTAVSNLQRRKGHYYYFHGDYKIANYTVTIFYVVVVHAICLCLCSFISFGLM